MVEQRSLHVVVHALIAVNHVPCMIEVGAFLDVFEVALSAGPAANQRPLLIILDHLIDNKAILIDETAVQYLVRVV